MVTIVNPSSTGSSIGSIGVSGYHVETERGGYSTRNPEAYNKYGIKSVTPVYGGGGHRVQTTSEQKPTEQTIKHGGTAEGTRRTTTEGQQVYRGGQWVTTRPVGAISNNTGFGLGIVPSNLPTPIKKEIQREQGYSNREKSMIQTTWAGETSEEAELRKQTAFSELYGERYKRYAGIYEKQQGAFDTWLGSKLSSGEITKTEEGKYETSNYQTYQTFTSYTQGLGIIGSKMTASYQPYESSYTKATELLPVVQEQKFTSYVEKVKGSAIGSSMDKPAGVWEYEPASIYAYSQAQKEWGGNLTAKDYISKFGSEGYGVDVWQYSGTQVAEGFSPTRDIRNLPLQEQYYRDVGQLRLKYGGNLTEGLYTDVGKLGQKYYGATQVAVEIPKQVIRAGEIAIALVGVGAVAGYVGAGVGVAMTGTGIIARVSSKVAVVSVPTMYQFSQFQRATVVPTGFAVGSAGGIYTQSIIEKEKIYGGWGIAQLVGDVATVSLPTISFAKGYSFGRSVFLSSGIVTGGYATIVPSPKSYVGGGQFYQMQGTATKTEFKFFGKSVISSQPYQFSQEFFVPTGTKSASIIKSPYPQSPYFNVGQVEKFRAGTFLTYSKEPIYSSSTKQFYDIKQFGGGYTGSLEGGRGIVYDARQFVSTKLGTNIYKIPYGESIKTYEITTGVGTEKFYQTFGLVGRGGSPTLHYYSFDVKVLGAYEVPTTAGLQAVGSGSGVGGRSFLNQVTNQVQTSSSEIISAIGGSRASTSFGITGMSTSGRTIPVTTGPKTELSVTLPTYTQLELKPKIFSPKQITTPLTRLRFNTPIITTFPSTKIGTKASQKILQVPLQSVAVKPLQMQRSALRLAQPQVNTPLAPITPTFYFPPILPPFIPSLKGMGFPSAFTRTQIRRQPFKYQPSLSALVFKIKAPSQPKFSFTGLGIRPIISKTKSKRRKK